MGGFANTRSKYTVALLPSTAGDKNKLKLQQINEINQNTRNQKPTQLKKNPIFKEIPPKSTITRVKCKNAVFKNLYLIRQFNK